MSMFINRFRQVHLFIFGGFAVAFSALTFWAVIHMSPGDWKDSRNHPYAATLLTICGPFTGAILRPYDPYSWEVARRLCPYCAAFILGGAFFQFVPLPFQRYEQGLRISIWVLGLLAWFGGGVVSLICAMGE
jgi:hypothetical protein